MHFERPWLLADKTELQGATDKTFDNIIDLGVPYRAGEGYPFEFFLAVDGNTTATGSPEIDIILESSDTEDFDDSVEHVLLKGLPKERLSSKVGLISERLPYGVRRYVRLKIKSTAEIACTCMTAGFAVNTQMHNNHTY